MKIKLLIFTAALICSKINAQIPNKFIYSTEIRLNNELIISQDVDLKISLLQDSTNGKVVFKEKHSLKTSNCGLANMVIGTNDSLILSSINWDKAIHFIRIEVDVDSDGKIDNTLTNQIISVPYAIHAHSADKLTSPINESDPLYAHSSASGITQVDTANWRDLVNQHKHYIGELYGGGIVYWVTPDGQHGLIVSKHDLIEGKKVKWDPRPDPQKGIPGARSAYDGKSNTAAIYADFKDSNYPATVCINYAYDGYDDWYLPSNLELQLMMDAAFSINKVLAEDNDPNTNGLTLVGKYNEWGRYWSSTEDVPNAAYMAWISFNRMEGAKKNIPARVRAIRSF